MTHAFCPECDAKITVGRDPSEGQQVSCPQCGAYLMVVGVSPLELDWAFDDEELEYDAMITTTKERMIIKSKSVEK